MKTYTHDEMLDLVIGEKGTAERTDYDSQVQLLLVGEAIKHSRIEKNMTQDDLGQLLGIKKSQVSRMEHGTNMSLSTVANVFAALGVRAEIITDNGLRIALR